MSLFSKTAALAFFARLHPEVYEILKPNVPLISESARNILGSAVIKSIAQKVTDEGIAEHLHSAGKTLFKAGIESMDYDDDFFPWPHPKPNYLDDVLNFVPSVEAWRFSVGGEEIMLNPQPLPPHEQSYYGALLTILAEAVSVKDISENLRNIGNSIMKQNTGYNEEPAPNIRSYSTIESEK